jgi:hypothetical protein
MSIARSTLSPPELVHKWNRSFPIGTPVRYWLCGVREGSGHTGCTDSLAEVFEGHTAVVRINGPVGWVMLSHVEPLPTGQGGAA